MLDFWGKNQATLVAEEENATASRYNREVVTLTTITTVATTYFTILGAQDELRILRKDVDDSSRILDLIMQQFGAGTVIAGQRGPAAERGGDRCGPRSRRSSRRCSRIWPRSRF